MNSALPDSAHEHAAKFTCERKIITSSWRPMKLHHLSYLLFKTKYWSLLPEYDKYLPTENPLDANLCVRCLDTGFLGTKFLHGEDKEKKRYKHSENVCIPIAQLLWHSELTGEGAGRSTGES